MPTEHLPFKPLDLERPIGLATGIQLAHLKSDPDQCRNTLDRSALEVRAIPSRRTGAFCGFIDAVQILRSTLPYSGPVRVTCPVAAALYLWEREVIAPAAETHLGSRVMRLDHLGTYSCRRIGGGTVGRPSEHATANAIDISAFHLEDGRRIALASHWSKGTAAERQFLRQIRDGACGLFQAVLSPDYNAAHRDHFHLDMGRSAVCR
ncbi:MAG: extensin family protein [Thalassobaculaceae bacterium]|nr:extensin family protein [Thalassobaculaceae bacterium]